MCGWGWGWGGLVMTIVLAAVLGAVVVVVVFAIRNLVRGGSQYNEPSSAAPGPVRYVGAPPCSRRDRRRRIPTARRAIA